MVFGKNVEDNLPLTVQQHEIWWKAGDFTKIYCIWAHNTVY